VTPVEFRGDLWRQKTKAPELSCGVVCVILRLAVLVELRLVTDIQTDTDTGPWLVQLVQQSTFPNLVINNPTRPSICSYTAL